MALVHRLDRDITDIMHNLTYFVGTLPVNAMMREMSPCGQIDFQKDADVNTTRKSAAATELRTYIKAKLRAIRQRKVQT